MTAPDGDHTPRKIQLIMELRRLNIRDRLVLEAIERVPRERFVPPAFADHAYDNTALPIARGQTISQPYIVALMTEALKIEPRMRVLEVGTGSGYQTAVLAQLASRVYTIERHRPLLKAAEALFADLGLTNILSRCGDGAKGWPEAAPFDRIIVTAAAAQPPPALTDQLKEGGIMVVPVGPEGGDQTLLRITKSPSGLVGETLIPVRFVPLVEGAAPES